MAIKKDEITTDITLELDEEVISIADFKNASDNFLDLVKEMSRNISDKKIKDDDWQVKLYAGSIGIGLNPSYSNTNSDVIIKNIVVSIEYLQGRVIDDRFGSRKTGCGLQCQNPCQTGRLRCRTCQCQNVDESIR